jgi:hypothetical protein
MSNPLRWTRAILLAFLAATCFAANDPGAAQNPGLYLKVSLTDNVKLSKLKPGDTVSGTLSRDVYASGAKMFSAGSAVRLTVDHLEKRKRTPNDHWPWVVKAFTPRHEKYPVFTSATVKMGESENSLRVALISVSRMREVHAKAKEKKSADQSVAAPTNGEVEVGKSSQAKLRTPTMVLEAFGTENIPTVANAAAGDANSSAPQTLPAGTRLKILLLGNVSASKSQTGDIVQARLLEPLFLNSQIALPAGTMFQGKVVKKTPPRLLSRAGSLYLTFTDITLPEGTHLPVVASVAGADLDERSHTRIDAEGGLRGQSPGKAWMAINLGVTAGVAKIADDGIQLVIEAIVSTATDVSTAGTGRIVAGCASALFMATRHGRDVVIPRFTEMEISLDRPVALNASASSDKTTSVGENLSPTSENVAGH